MQTLDEVKPSTPDAAAARPRAVPREAALATARWRSVALVASGLMLAVLVVNPWREFLNQDDGWAYARSVEHLLRTGEYRLDTWSAANMPVQVYLAAGLSKVFGYSLGLLRVATLLLLAAGLASFAALLRELGVQVSHAAVLTLALLASPLVLMLGFTFMSDVQFMSWLTVALWGYVRGLRRQSDATLLLASLAAGCAIGTRQFGMALIGGLLLAWLATRAAHRPPLRRLAVAVAVPLLVSAWQLKAGLGETNFTQAARLQEQVYFLTRPVPVIAWELLWRCAQVLQYLGILMLPLLPLLAVLAARTLLPAGGARGSLRAHLARLRRPALGLALLAGVLLACALGSSNISARVPHARVLPLHWMLPHSFGLYRPVMLFLALCGFLGALLLGGLTWRGLRGTRLRDRRIEHLLLAGTGLCLLGLHLAYVQLNDTYLVGFLPFALLVPAGLLRRTGCSRRGLALTAAGCLGLILALSLWMRGTYNRLETEWKAADALLADGIPLRCIGAGKHWTEYHGAFDAWLAETRPDLALWRGRSPVVHEFHGPFYAWLLDWSGAADYQVSGRQKPETPEGWRIVQRRPYRNAFFQQRTIYTFARLDLGQPRPDACAGAPATAPARR